MINRIISFVVLALGVTQCQPETADANNPLNWKPPTEIRVCVMKMELTIPAATSDQVNITLRELKKFADENPGVILSEIPPAEPAKEFNSRNIHKDEGEIQSQSPERVATDDQPARADDDRSPEIESKPNEYFGSNSDYKNTYDYDLILNSVAYLQLIDLALELLPSILSQSFLDFVFELIEVDPEAICFLLRQLNQKKLLRKRLRFYDYLEYIKRTALLRRVTDNGTITATVDIDKLIQEMENQDLQLMT